ncbi:HAD-IIB family hydrolase [Marinomonas ostreistagni]|nr:HAD-IIB family hydrolase [Marinomonas ostreistagni]
MSTLLVFTDLDGTLLDHFTYDYAPAEGALNDLKTLGIPCILNTSKTYAELLELRQALGNHDPFIVENGAAVYIPKHSSLGNACSLPCQGDFYIKSFGPHREELIQLISDFKQRYDFTCYSDLSAAQLAQFTGLEIATAELSLQRSFTEPLIWNDSNQALHQLRDELEQYGVKAQKGGRFVHLMGQHCDKAVAMAWLAEQYELSIGGAVTCIALGDGENDVSMIGSANIPVVVRSPTHVPPEIPGRTDVWITDSYGPKGWNEAITKALVNHGYV